MTQGYYISFEDESDIIEAHEGTPVNDTVENFAANTSGFEMLNATDRKPELINESPFTLTINGVPRSAEAFGGTHPPVPTRPRDPKW
jgi:hypothetical protein